MFYNPEPEKGDTTAIRMHRDILLLRRPFLALKSWQQGPAANGPAMTANYETDISAEITIFYFKGRSPRRLRDD